jgi:hypothetical protein
MKRLSKLFRLFHQPKVYPTEYDYGEETKNDMLIPHRSIIDLSDTSVSGYIEHRYPSKVQATTLIRFLEDSNK